MLLSGQLICQSSVFSNSVLLDEFILFWFKFFLYFIWIGCLFWFFSNSNLSVLKYFLSRNEVFVIKSHNNFIYFICWASVFATIRPRRPRRPSFEMFKNIKLFQVILRHCWKRVKSHTFCSLCTCVRCCPGHQVKKLSTCLAGITPYVELFCFIVFYRYLWCDLNPQDSLLLEKQIFLLLFGSLLVSCS